MKKTGKMGKRALRGENKRKKHKWQRKKAEEREGMKGKKVR